MYIYNLYIAIVLILCSTINMPSIASHQLPTMTSVKILSNQANRVEASIIKPVNLRDDRVFIPAGAIITGYINQEHNVIYFENIHYSNGFVLPVKAESQPLAIYQEQPLVQIQNMPKKPQYKYQEYFSGAGDKTKSYFSTLKDKRDNTYGKFRDKFTLFQKDKDSQNTNNTETVQASQSQQIQLNTGDEINITLYNVHINIPANNIQ